MKKIKFSILIALGFVFLSLISCSKDEDNQDARDQYVGTWNSVTTGSLTLFQNGQSLGTFPINESSTVAISKSGSNTLVINGISYIVNGNNLSTNATPMTSSSDGVTTVTTQNSNGTLGSNIINFDGTVTGTWNNTNGASGNLSGNSITVLTK
jgi:hypothetical protein